MYASLRHAAGDEVAYTSAQPVHESADFTLRVYVRETKRRERLTDAERREYDRAVEWAQWAQIGTSNVVSLPTVAHSENGARGAKLLLTHDLRGGQNQTLRKTPGRRRVSNPRLMRWPARAPTISQKAR
jgi:hypothetical protein